MGRGGEGKECCVFWSVQEKVGGLQVSRRGTKGDNREVVMVVSCVITVAGKREHAGV